MRRLRGFTLVELLTVMSIAAIMLAIAVPSFKQFVATQRVKSASYEIATALLLARSEAVKRNTDVTITPSTANTWTAGWSMTTTQSGTAVTLQNQASFDSITITKAPASITFRGTGRPSATSISYWEIAGTSGTRCVRLDTAGISSTSSVACP